MTRSRYPARSGDKLSEALSRGWGDRDSRSPMILQQERAGVEIRVDPQRIEDAVRQGQE
jgi:3-hydroxyisobutyrate dehydrogenase